MSHVRNEFDERPDLIRRRARAVMAERAWRMLWIGIGALVAVLLVWDITVGYQARERIADCTTPGGECYEEGQKNTGSAVTDIVDLARLASIAAAACADQPGQQTFHDVRVCTEEILTAQLKGRK
jgi:hypothetical protein